MKRWIALSGIVLLGVAAIWVSERRKVDVPAGPAAVLYLVADTEQELTRMPVSFTRMSDEEEIRIGDRLARIYGWHEKPLTLPGVQGSGIVSDAGRIASCAARAPQAAL